MPDVALIQLLDTLWHLAKLCRVPQLPSQATAIRTDQLKDFAHKRAFLCFDLWQAPIDMLYVSELILSETLNRMIQHRIDDLPSHFILCLLKGIEEHYHVALLLLVHDWLDIGLQCQKRLKDYLDLLQSY